MRLLSFVVAFAVVGFVTPARADEPLPSDRPVQAKLMPCPENSELTAPAPTPLAKRWYVWAAVGATFVAAVVVGVVVANSARLPPLTESQVCGGTGCQGCIGMTCAAAP